MGPGLRGAPGDEEFTRSSSRVVPRTSYYSNHPSSLGPSGPAGLGLSCASQTPRTCSHLALLTHSPPQPVAGPAWQQDTWPSSGSGPKAADLDLLPDKDTTARSPLSESGPSLLYITNQLLRTLTFFLITRPWAGSSSERAVGFGHRMLSVERGLCAASLDKTLFPFPNRQSF